MQVFISSSHNYVDNSISYFQYKNELLQNLIVNLNYCLLWEQNSLSVGSYFLPVILQHLLLAQCTTELLHNRRPSSHRKTLLLSPFNIRNTLQLFRAVLEHFICYHRHL
uniref:Uncharacterized protein n=1 Tax=Arion vulgaris TaxID=1028688 RepID=A0A0B6ZA71_9EUPU